MQAKNISTCSPIHSWAENKPLCQVTKIVITTLFLGSFIYFSFAALRQGGSINRIISVVLGTSLAGLVFLSVIYYVRKKTSPQAQNVSNKQKEAVLAGCKTLMSSNGDISKELDRLVGVASEIGQTVQELKEGSKTDPEVEELRKRNKELEQELTEIGLLEDRCRQDNEHLETHNNELAQELSELKRRHEEVVRELSQVKKQLDDLVQEDELGLNDLHRAGAKLESRNSELEAANKALLEEQAESLQLIERLKREKAKLENGSFVVIEDDHGLKQLQEKCLQLNNDNQKLSQIIAQQRETMTQQAHRISQVESRCSELISTNEQLEERLEVSRRLIVGLQKEEQRLLKEVSNGDGIIII